MTDQESFEGNSLWRPWCLAIVAEDKPFGIDTIIVSPVERNSEFSGGLGKEEVVYEGKVGSTSGVAATQELRSKRILRADWASNGDNHLITSPMVRKGETVMLYKYGDKPKLWWNTQFRESSIRRVERFIIAASNLSGGQEAADLESSYYIDFDTLSKCFTIGTSLSDGEQFSYTFKMSPKDNSASLSDNVGNFVAISSSENKVSIEDSVGGRVETKEGRLTFFGPKGIFMQTPGQLRIEAGDVYVQGPSQFTDPVKMDQDLTTTGKTELATSGASATFGGTVEISKDLTVGQDMTVDGYANFPGGHGPHNGTSG